MKLSYSDRAAHTENPTAQTLFLLMEEKQTNLCVAADVITKSELLLIADILGPEICVLKTHIDIISDFDDDLIMQLQRLSEKHNYLLFEDRKFADIGHTVKMQYQDGLYHIADWAHITNAHTVPGPGVIEGLKEAGMHKGRGLLLLAEMSPKGNLATGDYTKQSIVMAREHKDFVIGFIGKGLTPDEPGFINFMPGIKLPPLVGEGNNNIPLLVGEGLGGVTAAMQDNLKQQYQTPASVIAAGADIIIVGRGITEAEDMMAEAKKYREAGWGAYQLRTKS